MKATRKTPVHLREKVLKNGDISLYLDIYTNGKRHYEFLGLYLIGNPRTPLEREQNKDTQSEAETIRSKRQIEIQSGRYGLNSKFKLKMPFLDYFRTYISGKKENTKKTLTACLIHLGKYFTEQTTFRDITPDKVNGFKTYLNTDAVNEKSKKNAPLSENSKSLYFASFIACLNEAYKKGIIQDNPARGIKSIKKSETKREHLTFDEVKKLDKTECKHPELKRAFLFSCFSGLRVSDILNLTWNNVQKSNNGYTRIIFRQQKTSGLEYLDLSEQAAGYLGKRGGGDEKVFANFHYDGTCTNKYLREWVKMAGIDKYITFHSGRHTFATLELSFGANIYIVSKLLGHRNLSTTQIYAKIIDKAKQEAVSLIPNIHD